MSKSKTLILNWNQGERMLIPLREVTLVTEDETSTSITLKDGRVVVAGRPDLAGGDNILDVIAASIDDDTTTQGAR